MNPTAHKIAKKLDDIEIKTTQTRAKKVDISCLFFLYDDNSGIREILNNLLRFASKNNLDIEDEKFRREFQKAWNSPPFRVYIKQVIQWADEHPEETKEYESAINDLKGDTQRTENHKRERK